MIVGLFKGGGGEGGRQRGRHDQDRKGGVLHYTTTRLGELLDGSPGSSVVAYLFHTTALGYRGRQCGFDKSTKAPFYRTSSGVRLCWELKEPKGPA